MQVSHKFTAVSAVFDDDTLVSCAGLVPAMTLGAQTGLVELLANKAIPPETAFLILVNTSGAITLYVWLVISVSQLRMRRSLEAEGKTELKLKMWAYPYLTWLTIAAIVALLVAMTLLDSAHEEFLESFALAAVVVAIGVLKCRRSHDTTTPPKYQSVTHA